MSNAIARVEAPGLAVGAALFTPANLQEAMAMAKLIAESDLVPKDYKGKAGNVIVAMGMGAELGIPPLQALQGIAVINGRPAVWGDLLLAIVQKSPLYISHEETFDATTMTATAVFNRRGSPKPYVGVFSQKDAETARLWKKEGPWTNYPKRMLQLRARAFAIRDGFSDVLKGMSSAEELSDVITVETVRHPAPAPVEMPRRLAEAQPVASAPAPVAPAAALTVTNVSDAPGAGGKKWFRITLSDGEFYVTDNPAYEDKARIAMETEQAVRHSWSFGKGKGLRMLDSFDLLGEDVPEDDEAEPIEAAATGTEG